jgi:exopolyphosphatase/pppGpp-phosphohydrolase
MVQQLYDTVVSFKKSASEQGCLKIVGIATAVFRKARNGQSLLDRLKTELGVYVLGFFANDLRKFFRQVDVISQAEEGKLGFLTG